MSRMIFVNLPVTDLNRSIAFYDAVGATQEPRFSDESAAMMRFSETIHVMLLTHERFSSFTSRLIPDAHASAQALIALSFDSRESVDVTVERGVAKGGVADVNPVQDYGFMYNRSIADPDGHIWEFAWMDMEAAMKAGETEGAAV